jgi:ligand-binding SRPBCC domain-containing protein
MRYTHEFSAHASLAEVIAFHARSSSMAAITPPPIIVRIHAAPPVLKDGDQMRFTLWLGPLPLHWIAQIEIDSPHSFIDRQLSGPFALWEHRHTFSALDEQRILVRDEVTARLKRHPVWWLAGAGMWLGMPILFAYRGWKTRKILSRLASANGASHASPPLERDAK